MRFDKFTIKAQEAIAEAQSEASKRNNQQIEPVHLLYILLKQEDGVVPEIFKSLGVSVPSLIKETESIMKTLPEVFGAGEAYISPPLKQVLMGAFREAEQLKDEYVSTEHLLLAMFEVQNTEVLRFFEEKKIQRDQVLEAMMKIRGAQR